MDQRTIRLPLALADEDYIAQVKYAMSFAAEGVLSYGVEDDKLVLTVDARADTREIESKATRLLERFAERKFAFKPVVHFRQQRKLEKFDAWSALLERQWVKPVGQGLVTLRGLASRLFRTVEGKVLSQFVPQFGAEHEVYPAAIECGTLDRIAHFTSFPEHVDFLSHIKEDVDILGDFSGRCREHGWQSSHHDGVMSPIATAVSPSCCYHCYESMEGWKLERPGRCMTAMINCHRYEAGNLTTMSRLRSFHMREIIWVGRPDFVTQSREQAEQMLVQWAKDWEVDCSFENANDVFFTDDYAVKATFQRQAEAKKELKLAIPWEDKAISVGSSNFHGSTFGRAFGIEVDGRPAVSACMGWGLERWVYAVVSQFGLDPEKWPAALRADVRHYAPSPSDPC